MKELRSEVRSLVRIELERANESFPLFHSDHEGISVIREEYQEAAADGECLQNLISMLEQAIFCDMSVEVKESRAYEAEREAIELACEAIQTAAMLRKFVESHLPKEELVNDPFSQEDADALAEHCMSSDALKPEYNDFSKFIELLIARKKRLEEEHKNA